MANASHQRTYMTEFDDVEESFGDKMDLGPDWNDYLGSILNDIPQQAAAKQYLEPELSGYGEDILDDMMQRLANPYNRRPAQGISRDPRLRIRTPRDLA
jgi:hypothetical protein